MFLPLLLIFIGVISAAGLAYGSSSYWGEYPNGLRIIMLARTLQWPLVLLSLSAAMGLILLVISGKRRAWWLIGLAPILALFMHRFATGPASRLVILDAPPMVAARDAAHLRDDDYVVGIELPDKAPAYPFASLYTAPLIVHHEREKRYLLIWSAHANRALTVQIDRQIKPRELEAMGIVSDALLIYNARFGEFINGLTGKTPDGETPIGFGDLMPVRKMTWGRWKELHPDTQVLGLRADSRAPRGPIAPKNAATGGDDAIQRVILVGSSAPAAVRFGDLTDEPINLTADSIPVVLLRDPRNGAARAFDRRIEPDLSPRFHKNGDPRRSALLIDADTGCGWNADGVAVDGDKNLRGRRLSPLHVEEDIYLGALQRWYPHLDLHQP